MSLLMRLNKQNNEPGAAAANNREQTANRYHDLVHRIHREVIKEIGADYFNPQKEGELITRSLRKKPANSRTIIDKEIAYFSRSDKEEVIRGIG
jgi:hypothetical protein